MGLTLSTESLPSTVLKWLSGINDAGMLTVTISPFWGLSSPARCTVMSRSFALPVNSYVSVLVSSLNVLLASVNGVPLMTTSVNPSTCIKSPSSSVNVM